MSKDERYMDLAIRLARKAEGLTSPNPLVGAVIVGGRKIVGKGYHQRCGLPHAEINALKKAGDRAKGATLYVTLEPCDHFGRTPPCTDAIIRSGIKKVIIAMKDPNPINNGRGIRKLKRYGINTVVGVLEERARPLNEPYIKFITKKIPYVTVKIASSIDGKIATRTGDSRWITSDDSRHYVHEIRRKVDAIMVGVNTVIKDDPLLLSKTSGKKQPARIIVDSRLKTPLNAQIFSRLDISPLIIATIKKSPKISSCEAKGAQILIVKSKNGRVDLKDLLKNLAKRGIANLLVEGGGELIAGLIEERLVDRFLFFIAPKIIGGRNAITSVEGRGVNRVDRSLILQNIKIRRFKRDILIETEVK